jgi:pyroglutamyl-peptidase
MPPYPIRILVTGFGPFPGVIENASAGFAPLLAARVEKALPACQIAAAVLPVEWQAAPRVLERLIAEVQPAVCLHLGVATSARGVVLETYARNAAGQRRDAAGRLPPSNRLLEEAPWLLLPKTNPLRLLGQRLASDAVIPSLKAGDYLCNAIHFYSLWQARRQSTQRQVAFLHLPVRIGALGKAESGEANEPMDLERALGAVMGVLTALMDQATVPVQGHARI